jgi:hypothetical protein
MQALEYETLPATGLVQTNTTKFLILSNAAGQEVSLAKTIRPFLVKDGLNVRIQQHCTVVTIQNFANAGAVTTFLNQMRTIF